MPQGNPAHVFRHGDKSIRILMDAARIGAVGKKTTHLGEQSLAQFFHRTIFLHFRFAVRLIRNGRVAFGHLTRRKPVLQAREKNMEGFCQILFYLSPKKVDAPRLACAQLA